MKGRLQACPVQGAAVQKPTGVLTYVQNDQFASPQLGFLFEWNVSQVCANPHGYYLYNLISHCNVVCLLFLGWDTI